MSQSILDTIVVGNSEQDKYLLDIVQKEESKDQEKEYIDIFDSSLAIDKLFCPQPGHNLEDSIKDTINTGFDILDSLDLKPCEPEKLKLPLYKNNYLSEFKTEDEKRLARLNLGLFDEKDVVGMSLLTTNNAISNIDFNTLVVKSIELGKVPFAVLTTAKAVMVKDRDGFTNLQLYLDNRETNLTEINRRIDRIVNKSQDGAQISTLGDMMAFLSGYANNLTLKEITDDFLRFDLQGEI